MDPQTTMIGVIQGLPGAGKSLKLARLIIDVLYRNKKWFEKSGIKREVWLNLKLSEAVEKEFEGFIKYWKNPAELVDLRNVDVFWDEIATHLDATQWANMSLELKRWLQQHRKFGIDIYGTTQDFSMVDVSFRRLTSELMHLVKLFGSPDKSATRPEVKRIWGLVILRTLDPQKYDEKKSKFEPENLIPKFMWIQRSDIDVYDTTAEVEVGEYPRLRHIERKCECCSHVKIQHV